MVMDLLGPSLETTLIDMGRKFTPFTVAKVAL